LAITRIGFICPIAGTVKINTLKAISVFLHVVFLL
jgi:ATP-dependent RNA circularization protein (DNA/RNA ligase family)